MDEDLLNIVFWEVKVLVIPVLFYFHNLTLLRKCL